MTSFAVLLLLVLVLAYANGANDTFKGVATLLGSGTTSYPLALGWGTLATLAGSMTALTFSSGLLRAFSGRGLVPDAVAGSPGFAAAVALAAATTVLLATRLSMPISTTHALTGALLGAGLVSAGGGLRLAALGSGFILPLLLSPLVAMTLTSVLYLLLRWTRRHLGVERQTCVCVGETWVPIASLSSGEAIAGRRIQVGVCQERYQGTVLAVDAHQALGTAHVVTAGAVSFTRGLNDTPKIMALLLATQAFDARFALLAVGLVMALGALFQARRVGETMAHRITGMNHGQGFTANLVTAGLVLAASRFGLPVSTTHVSCGSLFGLGAVTGQGRWTMVGNILLAWVFTLPVAAGIAAAAALLIAPGPS